MLTFEAVRDVERAERENKKLQRLPPSWLADMRDYMQKKRADAAKNTDDLIEYENVRSIVERLFDLRERKLVEQALVAARTGLPSENLLPEEQAVFEKLMAELKAFRDEFNMKIKSTNMPADAQPVQTKPRLFKVKFALPPFVGPDLRIYKLGENEIVNLPDEVAEILLSKGVVEVVS